MLRVPIPTLAPPPSVQQICAMSTETSISLPSRRSQRRKRVFESHDDDLLAVKSPASKKLFSSKVETLKTKPVIVKTEVETLKTKRAVVKAELEVVEKPRVSSQGDCLVKAEEVESGIGEEGWCSLGVGQAELCLDLTLPTGQSFRWRKTGPSQYTGVINTHLVSLRQISNNVEFLHHASSVTASLSDVEKEIREYLNLDTSLVELYAKFTAADARFAAVAPFIAGARLLRQPPLECVFQFICSSNNHIQRITTMVDYLSSQGLFLGSVNGFRFHQFPTLDQLSPLSEAELRETGFGYRAKYVVGSVELLHQKEEGGEQWLLSLRGQPLDEVVTSLCTLPGIGPKVAACIALFSLDQHHAIPVDTHVWQIAVRYLLPELEGRKLTVKLHREVADAFVKRFGSYAGWAHTVLFIAELSSQQSLLPLHLRVPKKPSVKTPN